MSVSHVAPPSSQLLAFFAQFTLWQYIKYISFFLTLAYFLRDYLSPSKQRRRFNLPPEERVRRRMFQANIEMYRGSAQQRQAILITERNTLANLVLVADKQRSRKEIGAENGRKRVVIQENKNIYHDHQEKIVQTGTQSDERIELEQRNTEAQLVLTAGV